MRVRTTVTGPGGERTQREVDAQRDGELTQKIGETFEAYRTEHPDAPPFEKTVSVKRA